MVGSLGARIGANIAINMTIILRDRYIKNCLFSKIFLTLFNFTPLLLDLKIYMKNPQLNLLSYKIVQ